MLNKLALGHIKRYGSECTRNVLIKATGMFYIPDMDEEQRRLAFYALKNHDAEIMANRQALKNHDAEIRKHNAEIDRVKAEKRARKGARK